LYFLDCTFLLCKQSNYFSLFQHIPISCDFRIFYRCCRRLWFFL